MAFEIPRLKTLYLFIRAVKKEATNSKANSLRQEWHKRTTRAGPWARKLEGLDDMLVPPSCSLWLARASCSPGDTRGSRETPRSWESFQAPSPSPHIQTRPQRLQHQPIRKVGIIPIFHIPPGVLWDLPKCLGLLPVGHPARLFLYASRTDGDEEEVEEGKDKEKEEGKGEEGRMGRRG